MRCAILDVVSWFPGVLQQLWIDVSVRCLHVNVTTSVRRNQGWLQSLRKRRKRSVMEWPCDCWSSRLLEDLAARVPSCCVIWLLRRRQTDSAARIVSDDGGPSWSEWCWDPELRSDLLLSLLC